MRSVIVLDDIRVQEMVRRDGSRAYTIVWPDLTERFQSGPLRAPPEAHGPLGITPGRGERAHAGDAQRQRMGRTRRAVLGPVGRGDRCGQMPSVGGNGYLESIEHGFVVAAALSGLHQLGGQQRCAQGLLIGLADSGSGERGSNRI